MSGCVDTRDYVCNNRAATVHKNCALILWRTLMHHHKSPVFCAVRDSVYVLIQQATDNVPLESWGYNVRRSGCSYGGVTDSVPAWRFRVKLRVEQCTLLSFFIILNQIEQYLIKFQRCWVYYYTGIKGILVAPINVLSSTSGSTPPTCMHAYYILTLILFLDHMGPGKFLIPKC